MKPTGIAVEFAWNGRPAQAWVPALLSERSFIATVEVARASERAVAALSRMEERFDVAAEPIARLLLRSEGIASSAVEGLRVPLEDVLSVEAIGSGERESMWVAHNLAIVTDAIDQAGVPLTAETLHGWHRTLMAGSHLDESLHGTWRESPGWIGGSSPLDAVYVPPPADLLPGLTQDLLEYINRSEHDPITQAAIAHAQFEAIHPYGDGNGRIGRVLIGWILRRRGTINRLPPPISVFIFRDIGGYLSGLYEYREGDPGRWMEWFAHVAGQSAHSAGELFATVQQLLDEWRARVAEMRADSTVRGVIDLLPRFPVVSGHLVAGELDVSNRTALTVLASLENRGIVAPFTMSVASSGRPAKWWIATDLVDLVRSWIA